MQKQCQAVYANQLEGKGICMPVFAAKDGALMSPSLQEHYLMALSQPKGGAHALARKRMMEAALAKSRGTAGQLGSPSSVHSQEQATTFRQFAVSSSSLETA